jgi:glycosyltransferase 2 family protein
VSLDRPQQRLTWRTGIACIFGVTVVAFGVLFVVHRRHELAAALARLSWMEVAGALVLAALAQLAALASYRSVTADLGSPLPLRPAGEVYYVSQLGKYLPGTVWGMVVLVSLGVRHGVPRRTSMAAGVVNLVVCLVSAGAVAAVLLTLGALHTVLHFWYLALLLPVLVLALHPRVVVGVLDRALRKVGRGPVPQHMSYPGTVRAAGWQALCWLLYGLHAWVLALGLGADATPRTLALAVGAFALAYGVGPLFVLAPAGAGVRETVLVLLLGGALGGSDAALALALVSRVLVAVTEFGQAGGWTLAERVRRRGDRHRETVPVG